MKLIINCSTLSSTGPVQVAVSFIHECKRYYNQYCVFVSPSVDKHINRTEFPSNFKFYLFDNSPVYGIKGVKVKKMMDRIEECFKPDVVFTVFGPTTWRPHAPHLQGFAYGHFIYTDSPFYQLISTRDRIYLFIRRFLYLSFLKRDGKYYVCETNDVANKLASIINVERNSVFTVTNTCSHYFNNFKSLNNTLLPEKCHGRYRLLLLSSALPHKNLKILNQIIPFLTKKYPKFDFEFIVTLPTSEYEKLFTFECKDKIYNAGVTPPNLCPQLYFESDCLFSPSLIECFSANYPEAMMMERPILTTDLSFARTICGNAALYYSPLSPEDAAEKIYQLASDTCLAQQLVSNGKQRLNSFDGASVRAAKYLSICEGIIED